MIIDKLLNPELAGSEGELVLLRLAVSPHLLEDVLESLAGTPFPVNPQIIHQPGNVTIEFPAYQNQVDCTRKLLEKGNLPVENLEIIKMLNAIGEN